MNTKKRKITTVVVAGVTAVALLVGGTYAWTNISQRALNESAGIVNVGGRLHDDFNGTNKDVYVENFTNAATGGQPIYARIRLDEYMEVGSGAGDLKNPDRKATPIVSTMNADDVTTWITHKPNADNTAACPTGCNSETDCLLHNHWKWDLDGKTTFMPTFNKDKDSLEADINGTYAGTNPNDKVYYDDYVVYTTADGGIIVDMTDENFVKPDGAENASPITEANGEIKTVIGLAQYDNDTDAEKNETEGQYLSVKETHTAKDTMTSTVITMTEWETTYGSALGNYWVYDTDGWAYWANPIMPGEATGLLLDGIDMIRNPGEKCYYAINVVGQFATAGDWEYFDGTEENTVFDGTESAKALLEAAAASVPMVSVSGDSYIEVNTEYTFTATASRGGISSAAIGDFEWKVLDKDGQPVSAEFATITETEDGATLTVSKDKVPDGTTLIVTARSTNEAYLGATGVKEIVIRNSAALVPDVDVTVDSTKVTDVQAISLTADVMHNLAKYEGADIAWSITDENDNAVSENVATVNDGVLTIAQKEGIVKLKITASVTLSNNTDTETVVFEINASDYCDTCGKPYDENGFCENDCTSGQYEPAVLNADGETYEVSNGGQMFYMANKINADTTNKYNVTLTKDIDLEDRQWTPIGNDDTPYGGIFDGGGKSISNFKLETTVKSQGFFGATNNATLKDFRIDGDLKVTASSAIDNFGVIGNLGGYSVASGIHSSLNIESTATSTGIPTYFGGIAGRIGKYATIEKCSFSGTISGDFVTVAGIAGYGEWQSSFTIKDCLFTGSITMPEEKLSGNVTNGGFKQIFVGGIIGYYNNATGGTSSIQKCLSIGMIKIGDDNEVPTGVAAIAGCLREGGNVQNSYYYLKEGSNTGLSAIGYQNENQDKKYTATYVAETTADAIGEGTLRETLGDGWTQDGDDAYPRPNQWS